VTVWASNGTLLFSSNWVWDGTKYTTVEQALGGGSLQVH
jgi:hypothetical protein